MHIIVLKGHSRWSGSTLWGQLAKIWPLGKCQSPFLWEILEPDGEIAQWWWAPSLCLLGAHLGIFAKSKPAPYTGAAGQARRPLTESWGVFWSAACAALWGRWPAKNCSSDCSVGGTVHLSSRALEEPASVMAFLDTSSTGFPKLEVCVLISQVGLNVGVLLWGFNLVCSQEKLWVLSFLLMVSWLCWDWIYAESVPASSTFFYLLLVFFYWPDG